MFDRTTYKATARAQLRGRWAFPVVMTLIISVLLSLLSALTLPALCIAGMLALAQAHVYLRLARTDGKTSFGDFLHGLSFWLQGILGGLW
ncbi:MAG: hypothetical protein K2J50_07950, partial [Treponemataceae bacterium]|nr:hypothetical protein [Treponemataceae bacterium]